VTALTIVRPAQALTARATRIARGERGLAIASVEPGTREMAQLARAIEDMERTLTRRADYIRTFASHVSHEFKTPLTAIRGAVELLRDHLATMSASERERFLATLEQSSDRLERLVRRLLDLARADMAEPGNETAAIGQALERAASDACRRGLDVAVNGEPHALPHARIAADALGDVLSSLIDNARVHGGAGVAVRLQARPAPGATAEVEIVVADDGAGVSEANAARIFTPFFTTARDAGGSGLGLSIARALLEAHGGSIRLERTGRGATFVVRLPAAGEGRA
jgi:signal transduction histidine kinase